jgi:hypothetical protein
MLLSAMLLVATSSGCSSLGQVALSPSEVEMCGKAEESLAALKTLNWNSKTDDFEKAESDGLHLVGVAGVLQEDGSEISDPATRFAKAHNLAIKIIDPSREAGEVPESARFYLLESELEELSSAYVDLDSFCEPEISSNLAAELNPVDFFPQGLWSESSTQDLYGTSVLSHEKWWAITNGGGFSPAEMTGTTLYLACNVATESFAIVLARLSPSREVDELGPDGPVEIYYSIDGGPENSLDSYYEMGNLWPSMSDFNDSQRDKQGVAFWNLLTSADEKIAIKVDSPGENFEAEFFVHGKEKVDEDLKKLGCLSF